MDKLKIDYAISNGYSVLVIWEDDVDRNLELEIKRAINFLNN